MYDNILVPTDGSTVAETAGRYAIELAQRFDARLHVVYVNHPLRQLSPDDDDGAPGHRALNTIASLASDEDVDTVTNELPPSGAIHRDILRYAESNEIDCIVMGSHGRGGVGRFLLGSVAVQTLRESPIPVITIRDETDIGDTIENVLVPVDGSPSSSAAVTHARELGATVGATLHVVHVVDVGIVREGVGAGDISERLERQGNEIVDEAVSLVEDLDSVRSAILTGKPHQAILAYASEHDVDCIVVGTHGRSGIRRYILGSVSERIIRFSRVPVFAIKPSLGPQTTVEYLNYDVLEERDWSVADDDLFEKASRADLDETDYGVLKVSQDEYLLDAAENDGLAWPYYCRTGGCVNCAAIVVSGEVTMDEQRSISDEEVEEMNLCLTCTGSPASDSVRLIYNAKLHPHLQNRVL